MTTDGLHAYGEAVGLVFQGRIDYVRLIRTYGTEHVGADRYSPTVCTGCKTSVVTDNPDGEHISTSYIEKDIIVSHYPSTEHKIHYQTLEIEKQLRS